jgi:hypothetical protein
MKCLIFFRQTWAPFWTPSESSADRAHFRTHKTLPRNARIERLNARFCEILVGRPRRAGIPLPVLENWLRLTVTCEYHLIRLRERKWLWRVRRVRLSLAHSHAKRKNTLDPRTLFHTIPSSYGERIEAPYQYGVTKRIVWPHAFKLVPMQPKVKE